MTPEENALIQAHIEPDHYRDHPTGIECIDIVEHMNFNRGAAIKYLWRAGKKDDIIQDLKKAKWFVEREIARLEKEFREEAHVATRSDAPGSVQMVEEIGEGSDSTGMDRVRRLVRKAEQF